jgi:hypothetical protein
MDARDSLRSFIDAACINSANNAQNFRNVMTKFKLP